MNEDNREFASIEEKIEYHYRISFFLLLISSGLRIFMLDFVSIFTDLINAFIVYCTYIQRGKLMAIFSFINGVICVISVSFAMSRISFEQRFFYFLLIYITVVYIYLSVISYFAMTTYTRGCPCDENYNSSNFNYNQISNNYGSISQNNNNNNFVAFAGKGVSVGNGGGGVNQV